MEVVTANMNGTWGNGAHSMAVLESVRHARRRIAWSAAVPSLGATASAVVAKW